MLNICFKFLCFLIGVFSYGNFVEAKQEGWAKETLSEMTLDEKIGQLFIVTAISDPDLLGPQFEPFFGYAIEHAGLDCRWNEYGNPEFIENLIQNYHVGGVIYLGKARAASQIKLTNRFRSASQYPLFIALDCEWGMNHRLDEATKFPQSMTLGALKEDEAIRQMGSEIGEQCLSLGININFAPCVDVNVNHKNPVIHMRSYGDAKEKVAAKAIQYMTGMQDVGLITCAKHFPGHGDTQVDSHLALPLIDKSSAELHDVELFPFKKMIEAGVDAIMTAHLEVPAFEPQKHLPSSLSKKIVTDLLRHELKFEGLIITDALIMQGVSRHFNAGEIELKALLAGNDLLLCPTNVPKAIQAIKEALSEGVLTMDELDAHVLRVLSAKAKVAQFGGFKQVEQENLKRLNSPQGLLLKKKLFTHAITVCGNLNEFPQLGSKVCLIEVNSKESRIFRDIMVKEFDVESSIDLDGKFSPSAKAEIFHSLQPCEIVLINFYNLVSNDHQTYGIDPEILKMIEDLKKQGKTTLVTVFGTPYSLKLFSRDQTVIVGYENDDNIFEAAANVLCGHCKPKGLLPVEDLRYSVSL